MTAQIIDKNNKKYLRVATSAGSVDILLKQDELDELWEIGVPVAMEGEDEFLL